MLRKNVTPRAPLVCVTALGLAAVLVVVMVGSGESRASPAAARPTPPPLQFGPPALARYLEGAPHVASQLNEYGIQGGVAERAVDTSR